MTTQLEMRNKYNQKFQQLVTLLTTLKEKLNTTDAELGVNLNDSLWSFPEDPNQGFSVKSDLQQTSESFVESEQSQKLKMLDDTIDNLEKIQINADSSENQKKMAISMLRMCLNSCSSIASAINSALKTGADVVRAHEPEPRPLHSTSLEEQQPQTATFNAPNIQDPIESEWEGVFKQSMKDLNGYERSFRKNSNTAKLDADKLACIHTLKSILTNQESYQEKAKRFCVEIEGLKSGSALQRHRAPSWKRFIVDLISCLTVLPMLYRAVKCYSQFKQLNFFKPNSQNLLTHLAEEVKSAPSFARD